MSYLAGFLRANPNKLMDAGDSFGAQGFGALCALLNHAEGCFMLLHLLDLRWTMSKRSGDKIHLNADQFKVISDKLDDMLQLGYEHFKPLQSFQ
jgi:hypothetical protein